MTVSSFPPVRIRMSLKSVLGMFRKPTPSELARRTYGPEPYRLAGDVSVNERVVAVLKGQAKYLLREVIGLAELEKLPDGLIPQRFRKELPVSADEVVRHVGLDGLPKGFGDWSLQLTECEGGWQLVQVDIRGPESSLKYSSKREAELAMLVSRGNSIEPYVKGTLADALRAPGWLG